MWTTLGLFLMSMQLWVYYPQVFWMNLIKTQLVSSPLAVCCLIQMYISTSKRANQHLKKITQYLKMKRIYSTWYINYIYMCIINKRTNLNHFCEVKIKTCLWTSRSLILKRFLLWSPPPKEFKISIKHYHYDHNFWYAY